MLKKLGSGVSYPIYIFQFCKMSAESLQIYAPREEKAAQTFFLALLCIVRGKINRMILFFLQSAGFLFHT